MAVNGPRPSSGTPNSRVSNRNDHSSEAETARQAVLAKTMRLRALRLEKEAAEAGSNPPKKPSTPR